MLPRPASLVRVKEQTAMNIPPLRTSGTYTRGSSLLFNHFVTWFNPLCRYGIVQ